MFASHNHLRIRELIWPTALALAAALLYVLLVRRHDAPVIYPDEIYYGQLAQSLARGDGYTWRGASVGINSLYPYVAAWGWLAGGEPGGYVWAKAIGAVLACSTALPAYLIARAAAGGQAQVARWWALAATALTLAGSWMVMADRTMSEVLAWPLATWSLACLVLSLGPRLRPGLLYAALALALAAAATRFQLVILIGVVPFALGVDWLRRDAAGRQAWQGAMKAPALAAVALASLVVLAAAALPNTVLASYETAAGDWPPIDGWAAWTLVNLLEISLMCGVVPVVALLAMACSRANWRDERAGPLLAVALPAVLVVCAATGWFLAAGSERPIDRYLIYLLPLLFAALVAAPGRVRVVWGVTWALVVGTLIVAMPISGGSQGEAEGLYGALIRFTKWPGIEIGVSTVRQLLPLALLAVFIGLTGALLLGARRRLPMQLAAVLIVAVWVAALGEWSWQRAGVDAAAARGLLPAQRAWIDDALSANTVGTGDGGTGDGGATALLYAGPGQPEIPLANEFFSSRIGSAWAMAPYDGNEVTPWGPVCNVIGVATVPRAGIEGQLGTMVVDPNSPAGDRCPAAKAGRRGGLGLTPLPARNLLVSGRDAQVTFRDAEVLAAHPRLALELVRSRTAVAPRLLARVRDTCDDKLVCRGLGIVELWARRPGRLTIAFSSGAADLNVRIGNRALRLRRAATHTESVPVASGYTNLSAYVVGDATTANRRTIESVAFTEGRVTRTIYRARPPRQRPG